MSGHTPGPWAVWRGPQYVGGGEDLCIGAGDKWLANMDHRVPRCPEILDPGGHFDSNACSICSIDAPRITEEQAANARLIAAAPIMLEALEAVDRVVTSGGELGTGFSNGDWLKALAGIRAAIAKARGEDT